MAGRVVAVLIATAMLFACSADQLDFPAKPDAGTGASGGSTGGSGGKTGGTGGTSGGTGGQGGKAHGATCSNNADCASGYCVDGVCCDTECSDPCTACTAALKGEGVDGDCGPVADGTDPDAECDDQGETSCGTDGLCNGNGSCRLYAAGTECSPQTCDAGVKTLAKTCDGSGQCSDNGNETCVPPSCTGAACSSGCASDASCTKSEYCDIATGDCTPKIADGSACQSSKPNQCQSGFCADGVCCDAACTGTCLSCKAPATGGQNGECKPALTGTDPDGECADQGASGCGTTGVCNGAGACQFYGSSTVCAPGGCTGNTFTPDSLCSGAGSCAAALAQTCSPYACTASGCKTSCAGNSDCLTSFVCVAGACTVPLANGSACTAPGDCASGYCVDGVCCNTACGGTCAACSAAKKGGGSDGVCGPVSAGSDPDSECATQAAATCGTDGVCNGSGACENYSPSTVCAPAGCAGSTYSPADHCNGLGTCVDSGSLSCAPYLCTASGCQTSCNTAGDCVSGFSCVAGVCSSSGGTPCTSPAQCASGFCVDGVCCNTACTGPCQACSAAKKGGGTNGNCGAVGVGTDPDNDCSDQGAQSCGTNGGCDGAGACAVYSPGTVCSSASCVGSTYTPPGTCSAGGSCTSTPVQCAPYTCNATGCNSTCATSAECATGYACNTTSHLCQLANGATCSSGGQCASTYCFDNVCCATSCYGLCKACSAAKTGGTSGVCGYVKAGTDPDNECIGGWNCNGSGGCS
jgi:hypothetical protein